MAMRIEADIDELVKLVSNVIDAYTTAFFRVDSQKRVLKLWGIYSLSEHTIADAIIPFGSGPIGWVAENAKPFDLSKFSERDSGLLGLYSSKNEEIKSFAAVPVTKDGLLKGVLCVDSKSAFVFTNKDQKLLNLFAKQFADLVNNVMVREFVETESSDIDFLHGFCGKIASAGKVESILQLTLDSIIELLKCDDCFISLRTNGENGKFRIELAHSHKSFKNTIFSEQDGLAGCIIRGKEPVLLANRKEDIGAYVFVPAKTVGRFRSFLGVPLLIKDRVLGLICLIDAREGYFNQRDLQVVSIMVNNAALAIANTKAQDKANRLSSDTDGLTGLYNFSGFQERLKKAFQEASQKRRPLSLMIMDVDDFREINHLLGYEVGNEVLKRFAQVLVGLMNDESITPARYGSDEFSLILPSITREQSLFIAEKIHRATAEPTFISPSYGIHVSVSIGISSFSQDIGSNNDLIANALRALSLAKSSGGGKAIY